jgi:hypothetical protein
MIIRRNMPTALTLTVGALALFAVSCGSGDPATPPSSPVNPAPPAATPPPSTGGGVGASTCHLGEGDPYAPCDKTSSELSDYVEAAINVLVQEKPQLFDLDIEAGVGTRQYLVLDKEGYLQGIVQTLSDMGLCAGRAHYDYEIIQVKLDNEVSEDYDIISSDGYIRRGGGTYRQSCTPAAFPVPRPADAPPQGSGCGWPYPPPISRIKVKVHLSGTDFDTLDATPLVGHDELYCAAIGYTDGRTLCPVRPEGDPQREACEAWVVGQALDTGRVGPTWTNPAGEYCTGLTVNGCSNADNQYSLWVKTPGEYKACVTNGACGSVVAD